MGNRIMILDDTSSRRPCTMQGNFEIFVNAIKEKMRKKIDERIERGEVTLYHLYVQLGKPRLPYLGYRKTELDEPYEIMEHLKAAVEAGAATLQSSSWGELEVKEEQCQGRLPGVDDLAPKELLEKNAYDGYSYNIAIDKEKVSVEVRLSYYDDQRYHDYRYPFYSYWSWQCRKFEFVVNDGEVGVMEKLLKIYKNKLIDMYVSQVTDRLLNDLAEKLACEGLKDIN